MDAGVNLDKKCDYMDDIFVLGDNQISNGYGTDATSAIYK